MSANPFEYHGIGHLSASQLNLFRASPALWVVEYLLRVRGSVGVAAHCGTSVEAGVAAGLLDPSMPAEDCTAIATKRYRELTMLSGDPKREDKGAEEDPETQGAALHHGRRRQRRRGRRRRRRY